MDDNINLDRIQTNANFDFANLYIEIYYNEDDIYIYNDSPLCLNPNECKYLNSQTLSSSMLCIH